MSSRTDVWKEDIFQAWTDFVGKPLISQQVPFLSDVIKPELHQFLIHSCRGGGKTYVASFFVCFRIVTRTSPTTIVVVSGSRRQSQKLLTYCLQFLTKIPELKKGSRSRWPQSKDRITWLDGSAIIALTSKSEKSLRAEHGTVIIYDECTGIDEHALEISRGILSTESPDWKVIYLSTPSEHSEHWFDHLIKKHNPALRKYHWSMDEAIWIDSSLRNFTKNELKNSVLFQPEYMGLPAVFKISSKLTFPKALYSKNLISSASYAGGRLVCSFDPNFTGTSPSASRSACVVLERLSDRIVVHKTIDFTSCHSLQEQIDFALKIIEDPLGLKIPAHLVRVDSGAAQFLSELSKYIQVEGLAFQNRSRLEARAFQFLSRCYFVTSEDERHKFSKYPKRPFHSMSRLLEELRQYSPKWIASNKHDFTDALLLGLFMEYKPLPTVMKGSTNWMDVLKTSKEVSESLSNRKKPLKGIRRLKRESQPTSGLPDHLLELLKKRKKEHDN